MKQTNSPKTIIFSTGVHLQSVEVEINGIKQWRWVAIGFEDDTYKDGEQVEIYNYSDSYEGLFNNSELI